MACVGSHQVVTADSQYVVGNHCRVSGRCCSVVGNHNAVTGSASTVTGNHNHVYGVESVVTGNHNTAHDRRIEMTGSYNAYASSQPPPPPPVPMKRSGRAVPTQHVVNMGALVGQLAPGSDISVNGVRFGSGGGGSQTLCFESGRTLCVTYPNCTLTSANMGGTTTLSFLGHEISSDGFCLFVDWKEIPLDLVFGASDTRVSLHVDELVAMRALCVQSESAAASARAAAAAAAAPAPAAVPVDKIIGEDEAGAEDADDDALCGICEENKKRVLVRPCNHLYFCNKCALAFRKMDRDTCPLCRKKIETLESVFG